MGSASAAKLDRIALGLGPALGLVILLWLTTHTGSDSSATLDAIWILCTEGPLALMWIVAAVGLGWPLRRLLVREASDGLILQICLGVAAMLTLDAALGAAGALQWGRSAGAWALIAIGGGLAVAQLIRWARENPQVNAPSWPMWLAAPAVAVLLAAACSAPGSLWATEFGGYDALSYHLQLPKEWFTLGRIVSVQHNVYSFLPGYMEAAYYHLAVLRCDGIDSVYASQLLHAGLTLLTAMVVGRLATRLVGAECGAAAAIILLGTPWVIVVGSLGYNEMPTLLMLAGGWLSVQEKSIGPIARGAILGLLAGAACGSKLTSIGMVAVPLGVLAVMATQPRHWLRIALAACVMGLIVLSPYLLRNQLAAGNPVFPFATDLFGSAHWTAEQVSTWRRGHHAEISAFMRLGELWDQVLRFGIGPQPGADPWKPQWSVLPWIAIVGLAVGATMRDLRGRVLHIAIVLILQLAFWLFLTHLKSRFMLPAAVPMALGASVIVHWVHRRFSPHRRLAALVLTLAAVLWVLLPVLVYRSEAGGMPAAAIGQVGALTGDALSEHDRQEVGAHLLPAVAVNSLLPHDARVLGIGYATPLYIRRDFLYHTTWDRGVLAQAMHEHPDAPAAWLRAMRERGVTHVLLDDTMLAVWERAGWNDPLLTRHRVHEFLQQHAVAIHQYPRGVALYELRPD